MKDVVKLIGEFSEEHCKKCDGQHFSDKMYELMENLNGRFTLEAIEYEESDEYDG